MTIIALLALFSCSQQQNSMNTPERVGELTVKSLMNDNIASFIENVMLREGDFKAVFKYAYEHGGEKFKRKLKGKTVEEAFKEEEESMKRTMESGRESWSKTRYKGVEKGVDWKNIKYKSAAPTQLREIAGDLKRADILVSFSSGTDNFFFKLDDCLSIPDIGWRCEGIRNFKKSE